MGSAAQLPPPPIVPKPHYSLKDLEAKLVRFYHNSHASLSLIPADPFALFSCRANRKTLRNPTSVSPRIKLEISQRTVQKEEGERVCLSRLDQQEAGRGLALMT
jgi:hypothetical protein